MLTADPAIRKAVDDELYNLFCEENPRELEDYADTGTAMGGTTLG